MTNRTPIETLVKCMEDFGDSEAKAVLVLWLDSDGNLCWSRNEPLGLTQAIGMLEGVKHILIDRLIKDEGC